VVHDHRLRPLERRVLSLSAAGLDDAEIGRRFRHSPEWAARVRALCAIPRPTGHQLRGDVLRPLERRVLRWRASGADHEDFSTRFRRSPDFLRQVEALAQYRLRPPEG
jgi:DNA-binding CsgD family transcriptional regulator